MAGKAGKAGKAGADGPVAFDLVLGAVALLGGGMQRLFDHVNNHQVSYPVYALLGLGAGLLLCAALISKGVRAAGWLGLLLAASFAVLINFWMFRHGVSWPSGGFPKSLFRAIRGFFVLAFIEGVLIAAVAVHWSYATSKR